VSCSTAYCKVKPEVNFNFRLSTDRLEGSSQLLVVVVLLGVGPGAERLDSEFAVLRLRVGIVRRPASAESDSESVLASHCQADRDFTHWHHDDNVHTGTSNEDFKFTMMLVSET
jgi:hypothetical protein